MTEQQVREIVREELRELTAQLSIRVVEQSVNAISYGLRCAMAFQEEMTDDAGLSRD